MRCWSFCFSFIFFGGKTDNSWTKNYFRKSYRTTTSAKVEKRHSRRGYSDHEKGLDIPLHKLMTGCGYSAKARRLDENKYIKDPQKAYQLFFFLLLLLFAAYSTGNLFRLTTPVHLWRGQFYFRWLPKLTKKSSCKSNVSHYHYHSPSMNLGNILLKISNVMALTTCLIRSIHREHNKKRTGWRDSWQDISEESVVSV